jgi:hypothetical protein
MDIDLSSQNVPLTTEQTLTEASKAYRISLPRGCGGVAIQPTTTDLKVSYNATPGVTMAAYHSQTGDTIVQWPVYPTVGGLNGAYIYVETTSAGAKIVLTLMPRDGIYE